MAEITFEKFKSEIVNYLREGRDPDKPYICTGGRSYSKNQLADEIEQGTEEGINTLRSLIALTMDLVSGGKKELK